MRMRWRRAPNRRWMLPLWSRFCVRAKRGHPFGNSKTFFFPVSYSVCHERTVECVLGGLCAESYGHRRDKTWGSVLRHGLVRCGRPVPWALRTRDSPSCSTLTQSVFRCSRSSSLLEPRKMAESRSASGIRQRDSKSMVSDTKGATTASPFPASQAQLKDIFMLHLCECVPCLDQNHQVSCQQGCS